MEALTAPRYTPTEAARLVNLSSWRVRRWLQGYRFTYEVQGKRLTRHQKPVIRHVASEKLGYASFLELIDLLFIKHFLAKGISLQKLRAALNEAAKLLGGFYFARRHFFTDGRRIYLDLKDQKEEAKELLELLSGGQWVIAPVITQIAEQIVFDETTDYALTWYPFGRNGAIIVDPSVSFGRPALVGRGIATAAIFDLFIGEDENVDRVRSWMHLEREEIEAAVEFERTIRGDAVLN